MPTGVYKRVKPNSGEFKPGQAAHNKGIQLVHVKKKVERFKLGLPIECKHHGEHLEWRMSGPSNVQCKICSREGARRYNEENYLKRLAVYTKRRDRYSEVTEDFLITLLEDQENRCSLTGVEFSKENKPSVDRINSNIGYVLSNIQLVLFDINRMKTNLLQDDFIELCCLVAESKRRKK